MELFALLAGSLCPVERPSTLVIHGEDLDRLVGRSVYDDVGEARGTHLAFLHVPRCIRWDWRAGVGPFGCASDRSLDRCQQPIAETWGPVLVPELSLYQLSGREWMEPDRKRQRP